MEEPKQSKFSRRYDAQFKENAVALVESGSTTKEVARDLGCSNWSLRDWVVAKRNGQALHEPKTLASFSLRRGARLGRVCKFTEIEHASDLGRLYWQFSA